MSLGRAPGFALSANGVCEDPLGRFMLELSERMGMTKAELGDRMSGAELAQRRGLALVHADEQRRADEAR